MTVCLGMFIFIITGPAKTILQKKRQTNEIMCHIQVGKGGGVKGWG